MRKASRLVKLAFIGTPMFFAGCGESSTVVVERRTADHVEVITELRPNYHYSYFYGGYVPLFVPVGGYMGPGYYSGGYRAPRTVVNNYYRNHPTPVVKPPPAPAARPAAPRVSSTPSRSTPSTGSSQVHSGGFGSTGRGSSSAGG